MIIPIRCFTCGRTISHKWLEYEEKLQQIKNNSESPDDAIKELLENLGFEKYCCKRMFVTQGNFINNMNIAED
jgi:DNA-directed RNA polymerase subunit N